MASRQQAHSQLSIKQNKQSSSFNNAPGGGEESKFEVMKSRRHKLNTILSDYNEHKIDNKNTNILRKQLNPLNK